MPGTSAPRGRIHREKVVVEQMIRLYCRRKEGNRVLCAECEELLAYARSRLERCPHGEAKTSCRKCAIHCYRKDMADRIRAVMRFSGPRMIWHHPVAAIRHLLDI